MDVYSCECDDLDLPFVCTRCAYVANDTQYRALTTPPHPPLNWLAANYGEEKKRRGEKWKWLRFIIGNSNRMEEREQNRTDENLTPWIWHGIQNISFLRYKRQPFKCMLVSNIENVVRSVVIFNGNVIVNMELIANGCWLLVRWVPPLLLFKFKPGEILNCSKYSANGHYAMVQFRARARSLSEASV